MVRFGIVLLVVALTSACAQNTKWKDPTLGDAGDISTPSVEEPTDDSIGTTSNIQVNNNGSPIGGTQLIGTVSVSGTTSEAQGSTVYAKIELSNPLN